MKSLDRNLFVLLLISFISYVGVSLSVPILAPLFLTDSSEINLGAFNIDPMFALGLGLGSYPLGQFLGAPILGRLSDRFGRKKILIVSMVGTALGFFLSYITLSLQHMVAFILSRFFCGLWEGNIGIIRAAVSDMSLPEEEKEKVFGYVNFSITSGFLFGPLIGGLLSDKNIHASFDHTLPFLVAMVISGIACLGLVFYFKETVPDSAASSHHRESNETSIITKKQLWQLRTLMLVSFFITLSFDTFYEFYPVLLVKNWGIQEFGIGITTVGITLFMGLSQVYVLAFLKKFSVNFKIIFLSIILAILFVITPMIQNLTQTMFVFFIIGGLIALIGIYVPLYVSDMSKKLGLAQGRMMGKLMAYRYLGNAMSCVLGSLFAERSLEWTFIMAACFVCTGLVGFVFSKN